MNSNKKVSQKSKNGFIKALLKDVSSFEHMLDHSWFEEDIIRIGAEQEIVIIDKDTYAPKNLGPTILDQQKDLSWLVSELAQFNLEINLSPQIFTGSCISDMREELERCLAQVSVSLSNYNADYLLTGILPTLKKYHLDLKNLTPKERYYQLMNALRGESKTKSFELRLVGIDELLVRHDSPLMEACNTSFQVHLQVAPQDFAAYYNTALALTAPSIAISSNSPLVFGKRLWHETRIALFQQAIDTRKTFDHMRQMSPRVTLGNNWLDNSIIEIFKEDIARFRVLIHEATQEDSALMIEQNKVPKLKALQLHNGTVYRWNRPCYGISDTGKPHIRIENRVFPSGPTVADEMANTSFWLGAMVGMKNQYQDPKNHMSFEDVRDNFGKSARFGIDSKFTWFNDQKINAKDLILQELLPLAREGLNTMLVAQNDIDKYLSIIEERACKHMTGARWILRSYTKLLKDAHNKDEASNKLTEALYNNQSNSNVPVHLWKEPEYHELIGYKSDTMLVSEIMETDLFTSDKNDLAEMVYQLMLWKDFHYIPVEDKRGNLIGLVNQDDIKNRIEEEAHKDVLIKDVMIDEPITIEVDQSVKEAKLLMNFHGVNCLPVVRGKELIGMITEADLI